MKKRNRMIALLMGTVLTVSMAGTAMAGTTAAKASQTVSSTQKTTTAATKKTGNALADKKETKEFFGKVKTVNKDSLEIETAAASDETKTAAKTGSTTSTKTDSKTTDTKTTDTKTTDTKTATAAEENSKPQELTLDGKTMTVAIAKDTSILRETEDTTKKSTSDKASDKNTKNNDKKSASTDLKTEAVKLADLKTGDIVKVTMKDGKNVTEVIVLKNVKVTEKDGNAKTEADKKGDEKNKDKKNSAK